MTSLVLPSAGGRIAGLYVRKVTESVKVMAPGGTGSYAVQKLATDAIGTYTQVLKNVVAGSRYRAARVADNSLATPTANAEGTIPGTPGDIVDHSITLDYYAPGSSNNDLKIDVRKGTSAPKYKPFQTFATAAAGTVLAYCAQESDHIA